MIDSLLDSILCRQKHSSNGEVISMIDVQGIAFRCRDTKQQEKASAVISCSPRWSLVSRMFLFNLAVFAVFTLAVGAVSAAKKKNTLWIYRESDPAKKICFAPYTLHNNILKMTI